MIKLGVNSEIIGRRVKLLAALNKRSGTVAEIAKTARRADTELVRDDLEALRRHGLVKRESKPAAYSLH
jgi:DNA-binding IclR family transcriptional regulator